MATMKDVAARAGVSISTVSRVISEKIPVNEKTAEKVRKAIRDLNYTPNLLASGLRTKSGKFIGLLVPVIRDPFFAALIDYVDRCVLDNGFNLLLFNTHFDAKYEEHMVDNLLLRHVDGIIVSLVADEIWSTDTLSRINVPVVMMDRVRDTGSFLSATVDNREAGRMAAAYLCDLGHRNIACVCGPKSIPLAIERLNGFVEGLHDYGISIERNRILSGDFTFESGRAAGHKITSEMASVTAVWAQNDLMACGVIQGLKDNGIEIPNDISVMGMDNLENSVRVSPPLTTISQPIQAMAEKAVELILQKRSPETSSGIILTPELVVRESTRDCVGS